jgi:hypothetical protein
MFPVDGWPISGQELSFAESLLKDLAPLGFRIRAENGYVHVNQTAPKSMHSYQGFYAEAHRRVHKRLVAENRSQIIEFESTFGDSVFVEGKQLDFASIDPRLRPVDLTRRANPTPRDAAIVDYVRAYQTIASRRSVGRENAYILEDCGQPTRPVMGVLVLASPRYYQPHRDEVLGWLSPTELRSLSIRRQQRFQKLRLAGLNRVMQVAVCCALPPYSRLGAASLLAIAPFTAIVRNDFQQRWYDRGTNKDPDLVAVTTTTSMGLTGTPFQALYTSMFFDTQSSDTKGEKWNPNGTVYARIGKKHPWLPSITIRARDPRVEFQSLISDDTWSLALAVAGPQINPKRRDSLLACMSPGLRHQMLKFALDRIGLTTRIFQGNRIGVFLGAIDRPSLDSLREGSPRAVRPSLSWEKAIRRFKSEYGNVESGPCLTEDRRRAVSKRAARAAAITLDDILLSRH